MFLKFQQNSMLSAKLDSYTEWNIFNPEVARDSTLQRARSHSPFGLPASAQPQRIKSQDPWQPPWHCPRRPPEPGLLRQTQNLLNKFGPESNKLGPDRPRLIGTTQTGPMPASLGSKLTSINPNWPWQAGPPGLRASAERCSHPCFPGRRACFFGRSLKGVFPRAAPTAPLAARAQVGVGGNRHKHEPEVARARPNLARI